jgi:hypothetical protein
MPRRQQSAFVVPSAPLDSRSWATTCHAPSHLSGGVNGSAAGRATSCPTCAAARRSSLRTTQWRLLQSWHQHELLHSFKTGPATAAARAAATAAAASSRAALLLLVARLGPLLMALRRSLLAICTAALLRSAAVVGPLPQQQLPAPAYDHDACLVAVTAAAAADTPSTTHSLATSALSAAVPEEGGGAKWQFWRRGEPVTVAEAEDEPGLVGEVIKLLKERYGACLAACLHHTTCGR